MNLEDLAALLEGVQFDANVSIPTEQITEYATGVFLEQVNDFRASTKDAIGTVVRLVVLEAVPVAIEQLLAVIGAQAVIADAHLHGGAE